MTGRKNKIIVFTHTFTALLILCRVSLFATGTGSLDEVMQRHLEALGGREKVESIRTMITRSEIEMGGMKGTVRAWSLRPCLSLIEITLGIFNVRQGFDGTRDWMVGPNGKLQIRQDESSERTRITSCLIEDLSYAVQLDENSLTLAPPDTFEGVSCEVLAFAPEGGAPCLIYLDRQTFLTRGVVVKDDAGEVEMVFGDYRETAGVMFPWLTVTRQKAMGQEITSTTTSVEVNMEIEPAIFLPPGGSVRDYRFTEGSASKDIPFDFRNQHIYIPVRLAGIDDEIAFILDSGAGMTMIDSSLAESARLERKGKLPGAGAGGMASFDMTRIEGFSIRGIEFSQQTAIIFPISGLIKKFSGIDIGGVLGYDFLSRFVTRIDYGHSLISFFEPDSFELPGETITIKAPLLRNIFSIKGRLDGRYDGTFLVDTGASHSLLQKNFADRHGLLESRVAHEASVAGAGGTEKTVLSRFESFEFGGEVIEGPVFSIPEGKTGIGAFENIDGIIGNDILMRFTVYLDYERQAVHLEKARRIDFRLSPDRCGLQLGCGEDGSIEILHVISGTPAAEAGFRKGDRFLTVGETRIDGCEMIGRIMEIFTGDEGTTIDIEYVRDGKENKVSITLRTYI